MSTITQNAISALLAELDQRIIAASITTRAAIAAIATQKQNQCIGTLLPLEQDLDVALSLYRAILAIHRTRRRARRGRQGPHDNASPHPA